MGEAGRRRGARPRISAAARAVLGGIAVLMVGSMPAAAATGIPKVLTQETPAFQIRPAVISYTGDGTGVVGGLDGTSVRHLGHLRWTTYNAHLGVAVGRVWLDGCSPDCADGRFTPSRVRVRVSSPTHGHFRLLTLTYRYGGRRYVDRRVAKWYAGLDGVPGYWNYAICGIQYGPKC
jgi:hypothetical protein